MPTRPDWGISSVPPVAASMQPAIVARSTRAFLQVMRSWKSATENTAPKTGATLSSTAATVTPTSSTEAQ